ncbi:MAG: ArnT family glycosyltransferase [Pyrinomonadaceae bacterium]
METRTQFQAPAVEMPVRHQMEVPVRHQTEVIAAAHSPQGSTERRVRTLFWIAAIVLGLVHAWAGRYSMNQDGVSYLDIGDAYFRGDWAAAINAYWSPLYALLLGLVMSVVRPSPAWEFPVAHLLNFVLYLAALAAFDFLLKELLAHQRQRSEELNDKRATLPVWAWMMLGYSLFIWSTLSFIPLRLVTPDMCVAAFTYLAVGLLLRIRRGNTGWRTFAALGVVLGLGYLAKAAMFPLAFVMLGVALFAAGGLRKAWPRVAVALGVFLLIASPLIIALSLSKQRLTFGETGRITYAWFANGVPVRYWQGEGRRNGTPQHAPRKVLDKPALYEFATPVGGTYPVWYDPSYWYEGVRPRFDLGRQFKAVKLGAARYHKLFFSYLQSGLLFGWLVLLCACAPRRWWHAAREIAAQWVLLVPALATLALYALVLVEPRYVSAAVVLLWLGLYSGVRLPAGEGARHVAGSVAVVAAAALLVVVGLNTFKMQDEDAAGRDQSEVVEELRRVGVQPGDKVAVLYPGDSVGSRSRMTAWARLARARIVAEIPPRDSADFWAADEPTRARVIESLAGTGAKVIITEDLPPGVAPEGWQRLGGLKHHVRALSN